MLASSASAVPNHSQRLHCLHVAFFQPLQPLPVPQGLYEAGLVRSWQFLLVILDLIRKDRVCQPLNHRGCSGLKRAVAPHPVASPDGAMKIWTIPGRCM